MSRECNCEERWQIKYIVYKFHSFKLYVLSQPWKFWFWHSLYNHSSGDLRAQGDFYTASYKQWLFNLTKVYFQQNIAGLELERELLKFQGRLQFRNNSKMSFAVQSQLYEPMVVLQGITRVFKAALVESIMYIIFQYIRRSCVYDYNSIDSYRDVDVQLKSVQIFQLSCIFRIACYDLIVFKYLISFLAGHSYITLARLHQLWYYLILVYHKLLVSFKGLFDCAALTFAPDLMRPLSERGKG